MIKATVDNTPVLASVRVPATSANLGTGFDTLGMALDLYLTVDVFSFLGQHIIEFTGEGEGTVTLDRSNLIYQSLRRYAKVVDQPLPEYSLRVRNPIPLSRGLGSSGAAIVAGLLIGRALFNRKLSLQELLETAADIEGHGDNTSASLLGGITLCCKHGERLLVERITPPPGLWMVAVVPEITVSTEEARAALPASYPRPDVVHNLQHLGRLIHALTIGRLENIGAGLDDRVHQPTRSRLVPGYDDVVRAGLEAGALGVHLSGSGPTIMAWCTEETREQTADRMTKAFTAHTIQSRALMLQPVADTDLR